MTTTTLTTLCGHAPAIECEGCANSIKRTLGKLPGVREVEVDVAGKNITVRYVPDEIGEAAIRDRLAAIGFALD